MILSKSLFKLNPALPATRDGYLQPFRFVALEDEHHRALSMTVEAVSDKSFQGIRSSQWSLPKSI